jgi:ABC-type glycerol-3-phosphate transport system substrate-binding protein
MKKAAWIVTFYAFKGGTGRTQALVNVARYLAEDRGYRVGVVDLDIDAPGLAHEPLCQELEEVQPQNLEGLGAQIDSTPGFMELFLHSSKVNEPMNSSISRHTIALPASGRAIGGTLFLLPAGQNSITRPPAYRRTVAEFTEAVSGSSRHNAPSQTLTILEGFIDYFSLDFVFLDGRTGAGPFASVYAKSLPHALVLLVSLNDQNIFGALDILRSQGEASGSAPLAPVFLVASPVPTGGPLQLEERLNVLEAELLRQWHERADESVDKRSYIYELPRNVEFHFPYSDLAAYRETYFIAKAPRSALALEYVRLASAIEGLVEVQSTLLAGVDRSASKQLRARNAIKLLGDHPLRIAAEDVMFEALNQFVCEQLGGVKSQGKRGSRLIQWQEAPGVEVEFWPATEKDAPWESFNTAPDTTPPDILLIPQSHLGVMNSNELKWRDLTESRYWLEGSGNHYDIFDYQFLDQWYPGWRRWCTLQGKVIGLPFSANATLLCANDNILTELCDLYWHNKLPVGSPPPQKFMPSSWLLLRDLAVVGGGRVNSLPLAFAGEGRGLYYEWLNVILACGAVDLEVGEGNIVGRCGIAEAVDATRLFLNLRQLAGKPLNHLWKAPPSMSEVITAFGEGRVGLYLGWSDSFRFESTDNGRYVRPIRLPARKKISNFPVRLAPVPRDIRYRRRPLIAGWIMLVNTSDADRLAAALAVADLFLDPLVQRELLSKGFPTPSLGVIEEELHHWTGGKASRTDICPNDGYLVFLSALREALYSGHWVPAVPKSREIMQEITSVLNDLAGREQLPSEEEVNASLRGLHEDVVNLARIE